MTVPTADSVPVIQTDWRAWVGAPGSWAAEPSPDGTQIVFISDSNGFPRAWVSRLDGSGMVALQTGRDHAEAVSWSPDGEWIAVLGAPGGESTRTRVWVVRPDGRGARRVAGVRSGTAAFGPWLREGAVLPLSTSGRRPEETSSTLLDVHTGVSRPLGYGDPFTVLDVRHDGGAALVRVGGRGRRTVLRISLRNGKVRNLIAPGTSDGVTDQGSFLPDGRVLVRSNLRRDRYVLMLLGVEKSSNRGTIPEVVAVHPGGELDSFAVTNCGERAALLWNVRGLSVLEVMHLPSGRRRSVAGCPELIDRVRFSADGSRLVVSGQGPLAPRGLWHCDPRSSELMLEPIPVAGGALPAGGQLIVPVRERFVTDDGLTIEGWLYRPAGVTGPVPTVIHLHGGPEAQERMGFAPLFQAIAAGGIAVFAPNVRGSTGYGRAFEQADGGALRFGAISDVAACALHLLRTGIASHGQLACMGRSYGGYLTLAALTWHPELFAAGVDICGMSDLLTFFADTEPWVAAVATTKYGDPLTDAALLAELSPLRRFQRLRAPLLVVHGVNDRNVPVGESRQAAAAARERGVETQLLLFPDEGHEIARISGKVRFAAAVMEFLARHLAPAPAPPVVSVAAVTSLASGALQAG
ncbi:MAG TPA: prolyl oligopeptidase family serine peptidase [Frankiaceae bacterium]|jgi:dipeptidyl aminopeptidase/acylaminoacyl peptidase|nr:prolyl oligopeptidase family serine peptidase [Frankiaceae bacterium]